VDAGAVPATVWAWDNCSATKYRVLDKRRRSRRIFPVAESLTDGQILQAVRPNNVPEAEELAFAVDEEEEDEVDVIPTSTATVASLETALRWFEMQDIEPIKIMQLRSLLQFAKRKQHSSKKQK
ncbi:hypothetical protein G0U57_015900, partial [Chelydra serpentina]